MARHEITKYGFVIVDINDKTVGPDLDTKHSDDISERFFFEKDELKKSADNKTHEKLSIMQIVKSTMANLD